MKLELLTKALRQYIATCPSSEIEDVSKALIECSQTANVYNDRELWKDECCIVPISTIIDVVNVSAYDIYGKLARQTDSNVPFSKFATEARYHTCLEQLTDAQLEDGYYYLSDLWHDNEANGYNKPDGTYQFDHEESTISCLRQSFDIVKSYYLTNEDVLEPDENDRIKKLIDSIQHVLEQWA